MFRVAVSGSFLFHLFVLAVPLYVAFVCVSIVACVVFPLAAQILLAAVCFTPMCGESSAQRFVIFL